MTVEDGGARGVGCFSAIQSPKLYSDGVNSSSEPQDMHLLSLMVAPLVNLALKNGSVNPALSNDAHLYVT